MYVLSHNHTFDTLAAITTDGELVELEMKIGTRGLHSTARRRWGLWERHLASLSGWTPQRMNRSAGRPNRTVER